MGIYSRALNHIDMTRVKELREEKIKRKKDAKEFIEQIRDGLRNLNSPEFSNWRCNIDEGMTSSGLFQTTLPATGDVDLLVTSMDASSFVTPEDISFNSGTNSGFTGGFSADNGIMNFSGDVDYNTNAITNDLDLSSVDTVSISAIAGNNSNGGMLPSNDLKIIFLDSETFEDSDEFTVISKTSSSFSNKNITIPEKFRKPGVQIFLFSSTGEQFDQGQHLKPFTISISGLNHATMGSIPVGAGSATGVNNLVTHYLQQDATTANYKFLGQYLWNNIQIAKNGFSLGDNPNYGEPGEYQYMNLNNWDPAPVSGNRNQNGTVPDTNGNDAPGVTDADYIHIGQHMFDTYKGSKLYGISNISLKRKTPMNVFVSLDSPEATSFIRTDPVMAGLSAEGRRKKLLDMLDAGDEYLLKYLGIVGSKARPSDTTMPDSWEQAAAQQGPMPTGPSGYKKPGTYDPNKFYNLAPGSLPSPNIPYTGPGQSNVPGTKDYGNISQAEPGLMQKGLQKKSDDAGPMAPMRTPRQPAGGNMPKYPAQDLLDRDQNPKVFAKGPKKYADIAATYGGADAERKRKLDAWKKKNTMPGRGIYPYRPGTTQPYNPQTDLDLSAHYEPEGEVLSEKKKLKSVKDITSKIPGYYDGKPAPLGFPMDPPPKTINGYHPDLVTSKGQKKQSNRYNRLDPASAKAMPPTGNPHIDKKVKAAAKKPK